MTDAWGNRLYEGGAGRAGRDVGGMRVRSKEIPGEKNHRGIYVTLD